MTEKELNRLQDFVNVCREKKTEAKWLKNTLEEFKRIRRDHGEQRMSCIQAKNLNSNRVTLNLVAVPMTHNEFTYLLTPWIEQRIKELEEEMDETTFNLESLEATK